MEEENIVNVVIPRDYLNLLKEIEGFETDLGKSFTDLESGKENIKDKFVKNFRNKYNNILFKVGRAGNLHFYHSHDMEDLNFYVNIGKIIKKFQPNDDQIDEDFKVFLSKIIYETENEQSKQDTSTG